MNKNEAEKLVFKTLLVKIYLCHKKHIVLPYFVHLNFILNADFGSTKQIVLF